MTSLMRLVTAGAAWKTGAGLFTDCSHQTILRWEYRTCAALILGARAWYRRFERLLGCDSDHGAQWAIHSIRSDGTNQKILHKEPLHVTSVASRYSVFVEGSRVTETDEFFGDILIRKSKTASASFAYIKKQMKSVGAPTYDAELKLHDELTVKAEDGSMRW